MAGSDRAFFRPAVRSALAAAGAVLALAACAGHEAPRAPAPPPPPVAKAAPTESVYTVARGDTLSAIARRYGVAAGELARRNGLKDPHRLAVGQRLVVPAEPEPAAVAAAETPAAAPAATRKPHRVSSTLARTPPVSSAPPPLPFAASAPQDDRLFVCVDAWIDEGQVFLRGARYEEAIESAQKARAALEQLGGASATARTARLEILSASAEIALGRSDDADASFTRALSADPSLRLDEATMSPKVVRAFEETRKSVTRSRTPGSAKFEGQVASDGSTTAAPASF